jgi:Fe-S-cluster containining protein
MGGRAVSAHEKLLRDWEKNAVRHESASFHILHRLRTVDDPGAVDALARAVHAEVFGQIDCTRCANCCKTASPGLGDAEVDRIAAWLDRPREAVIADFLEPYPADGRFRMRTIPCPFLGPDDRCTIYEVRPDACRNYPNTDRGGFTQRPRQHTWNTRTCPAVYHIVRRICEQLF